MKLERPTYRYVFVFDISQSMNVIDVANTELPLTRLDYAKQTAAETLSILPCGTEVGLALFTGHRAFLLITPIEICANYRELSTMLNNIEWRMTWEKRSEIAKGLYKSIALLKEMAGLTRLVFFTDGHEAPPINPDLPPRYFGLKGEIRGLIMGVGGEKPVPIPKFDETGKQLGYWKAEEVLHIDSFSQSRNTREGIESMGSRTEHLSSLRETYLEGLANKTGLIYRRLANSEEFSAHMKSKSLSIPELIITDMRWFFALGSLLTFVAASLITSIKQLPFSTETSGPSRT